jgi:hypothetical protein
MPSTDTPLTYGTHALRHVARRESPRRARRGALPGNKTGKAKASEKGRKRERGEGREKYWEETVERETNEKRKGDEDTQKKKKTENGQLKMRVCV